MKNINISSTHQEYISRINYVQDYIEANVGNVFTLEELAMISGFSKYHFHRIFKGIVKETLYQYINRLKLEKAASFLLHNPKMSITEIAFKFGFTSSAVFSRSFNKFYGMSATKYRLQYSNNSKVESNNSKDDKLSPSYNKGIKNSNWSEVKMVKGQVEVREIAEMNLVYVRHTGAYKDNGNVFQKLIKKLVKWAEARYLIRQGETKLLAIYHDNPEITKEENQRTSICITVPEATVIDGDIGKMTIASGKYAIGHFEIDASEYSEAWNYLYTAWLLNSGYQPNDGVCFEVYLNDPSTHPEGKHLVDIYLPVKPL